MKLTPFAFSALGLASALLLSSCETTTSVRTSGRTLPAYEAPMARAGFQTVRTTAYTHSEADHIVYGRRNAVGGRLSAASRSYQSASTGNQSLAAYLAPRKQKVTKWVRKRGKKRKITVTQMVRPTVGSAAADWSRWPYGTVFRVLSTGQIYKVDDYGWALSGRNTIDLYKSSRREMNAWGVRHEPVQILKWGDELASKRVLAGRAKHKHCRRMLLALEGDHAGAAALK